MPPGFGTTKAIKDLYKLSGEILVAITAPNAVATQIRDDSVDIGIFYIVRIRDGRGNIRKRFM